MSGIHPLRTLPVLALSTTSLTSCLALATNAAPASAASNPCHQVSLAEVSSTLGLKVTKLTPAVNGDVTVCWYQVGANPDAVFVRTQTHDNVASYTLDKKTAAKQGESPSPTSTSLPTARSRPPLALPPTVSPIRSPS